MLSYANTLWVLLGTLILGLASGVLGSFALLRKQSLIGDAVAHASLPGICLAFLVWGEKSIPLFLVGAVVTGLLSTYCIQFISRHSRIKEDTSIGLILSLFFGIGIVLLTLIQNTNNGNQSGLDAFLFGQAASLIEGDVWLIAGVATFLLLITVLFYKEFTLLAFDRQFGQGMGFRMGWVNLILMLAIVIAVVIGLQVVGVVLMASMLITPAIAARYWTDHLGRMVLIAGLFGGLSGVMGTWISTTGEGMATGPWVVLSATFFFLLSMLFAPKRGFIFQSIHRRRNRAKIEQQQVMISLYQLTEEGYQDQGFAGWIPWNQVEVRSGVSPSRMRRYRRQLLEADWIQEEDGRIHLTPDGWRQAEQWLKEERRWQILLMYEAQFSSHRMERMRQQPLSEQVPQEMLDELDRLLIKHDLMPKLQWKYEGALGREEMMD